jgi:hypothetical protein
LPRITPRRRAPGIRRILPLTLIAALTLFPLLACSKPEATAEQKKILACGIQTLSGPLAATPNVLQRATQVYQRLDDGGTVEEVIRAVYGKNLRDLTAAEIDEVILILSGLDDCSEASPELRSALLGAISTLRSGLPRTVPNANESGAALCPGDKPFDDQPDRFQPNCGEFTLEGRWVLIRSTTSCTGLSSCDARPVEVEFSNCTENSCLMARIDGVWNSSHDVTLVTPGSWSARFEDIAVACEDEQRPGVFTYNPGTFSIDFQVTSREVVGGIPRATAISGTYRYTAAVNPPTCVGGTAAFSMTGSRGQ